MEKFNLNQLLNAVSKPSATDINEDGERSYGLERVEKLSIYDLIPSNDNFYSVAQIEELKESIALFGIKQNLTVAPLEKGKYRVIAGHRRRLAALELLQEGNLDFEFVPCGIETAKDELIEKLLLIQTNSTARQLTDWEKLRQVKEMRSILEELKKREKLPGRMRELLAEALHTSPTQIARMEAIDNNLAEDFKYELRQGSVNMSTAYELSGLNKETQQEVFTDYKNSGSLSVKEAKEKKLKNNQKEKQPLHQGKNDIPREAEGDITKASFAGFGEDSIPKIENTIESAVDKPRETRCIGEGICPYCDKHFDAGMAVDYNINGTPNNETVDCLNCGRAMVISCIVEYFCMVVEDC